MDSRNQDPLSLAIRQAVAAEIAPMRDELAELIGARQLPRLLNRQQLQQWLQVSGAHIRKLVDAGLPEIHLGEAIRYDIAQVQAWLDGRGKGGGQ